MEARPRTWAEVSPAQIAANFRNLRSVVGPEVEVLCVVKSSAYGHGMIEATRVLLAEGARWLGVTSLEEGMALREAGIDRGVLVMADALASGFPDMLAHRLIPAVHSLEDLRKFDALARERGERAAVHLKIDSGMGRLGIRASPGDIIEALRSATHLQVEGLMSHFASADDFTGLQSEEQLRAFDGLAGALAAAGIAPRYQHISATSAVAYGRRSAWKNMVRVGLALYGYVSPPAGAAPPGLLDVRPALSWKARILTVQDLPAGVPVGYGARFVTTRPTRIAVIAAGYADGVFRQLSGRGSVIVAGHLAPVLGTLSMDITTVDVTECPEAQPGGTATLLGDGMDARRIAELAGTISYDVLCKIHPRVPRIYV